MEKSYLTEKSKDMVHSSGVYLMKDKNDVIIYVGKALDLKKRLSSYFSSAVRYDLKTNLLIKKISDFEVIITKTEQEALILESNLIKRYKPRYNIILKDDKRYPCLKLDIQNRWSYLSIARKIEKDGAVYFGPFSSASAVRRTLKFIDKNFKLRKCRSKNIESKQRACLNFQMNICMGPCRGGIVKKEYDNIIKEVILFLKGRTPELIKRINSDMLRAAEKREFEKAAELRDKKFAIEKTLEKQFIVNTDLIDRDVIGIAGSHKLYIINILYIRGGNLVGTKHFEFADTIYEEKDILSAFLRQYYEKEPFIPKEILIPFNIREKRWNQDMLIGRGEKVKILSPKRGNKVELIKRAFTNAQNLLEQKLASDEKLIRTLLRLKEILKLDNIPKRIECFDNSNISGTNPVSGMVVFIDGKPEKKAYRKYRIETKEHNDYAYMYEALKRRFSPEKRDNIFPDLLMVDGGKGQLNIAVSVLRELCIESRFEVIGIAKKDEKKGESEDKIYRYSRANPINFGNDKNILLFLQMIRDEAHRFAVSFHRNSRKRKSAASILDGIYGIGKKRKGILLKHYKSIENIKKADINMIRSLLKISDKTASLIKEKLNENS